MGPNGEDSRAGVCAVGTQEDQRLEQRVCVCVCVCACARVRERDREEQSVLSKATVLERWV